MTTHVAYCQTSPITLVSNSIQQSRRRYLKFGIVNKKTFFVDYEKRY